MSRRTDIIVTAFALLGAVLAVLSTVRVFAGDAIGVIHFGIMACYCALTCVFVVVYADTRR